jgi:hypothetical protein
MIARVAIVGAGAAGLAAAYGLRTLPVERTVFEKSRGFGGRAATRGAYGCRYDHGAPFFSAPSGRVERLVTAHLPTDQLVEVGRPVGAFAADGTRLRPTSEAPSSRWTYVRGISTLGKLLARHSRAEVRHTTRIEALERKGERWGLRAAEGTLYWPYDAVVLTPPAPQSAALLGRSPLEGAPWPRVQEALAGVSYGAQFAYLFGYDRRLERPARVCGLASADAAHPLDWIGFERDKPGHVPTGQDLLVVHTAPRWTADRVDQDPEQFIPEVRARAAEVLSADLQRPTWDDTQRWRYARPQGQVASDVVGAAATQGLYLAGDAVAAAGTVGAALDTGLAAAQRLRDAIHA